MILEDGDARGDLGGHGSRRDRSRHAVARAATSPNSVCRVSPSRAAPELAPCAVGGGRTFVAHRRLPPKIREALLLDRALQACRRDRLRRRDEPSLKERRHVVEGEREAGRARGLPRRPRLRLRRPPACPAAFELIAERAFREADLLARLLGVGVARRLWSRRSFRARCSSDSAWRSAAASCARPCSKVAVSKPTRTSPG